MRDNRAFIQNAEPDRALRFPLREAFRALPGTDLSLQLEVFLADLTGPRWAEFLIELAHVAGQEAERFGVTPEDVLGDLIVLTHDRWLPAYREELANDVAEASLKTFLQLQLRGYLFERRPPTRRVECADTVVMELPPFAVMRSESEPNTLVDRVPAGARPSLVQRLALPVLVTAAILFAVALTTWWSTGAAMP